MAGTDDYVFRFSEELFWTVELVRAMEGDSLRVAFVVTRPGQRIFFEFPRYLTPERRVDAVVDAVVRLFEGVPWYERPASLYASIHEWRDALDAHTGLRDLSVRLLRDAPPDRPGRRELQDAFERHCAAGRRRKIYGTLARFG